MKRPSDPHIAIVWAACNDTGLHLSAEEVLTLAADEAILKAAEEKISSDTAWQMAMMKAAPDWSREQLLLAAYEAHLGMQRAQRRQKSPGPKPRARKE